MSKNKFLRMPGIAATALVLLFFIVLPVRAQTTTATSSVGGAVTGKVLGPGNVAVPGARVVLFNVRTRVRKETWTNETGHYAFRNIPAGEYRMVVMIVGFRPSILGPVDVKSGESSAVNATLALAMPGEPSGFGRFGSRRGMQPGTGRAQWAGRQGEHGRFPQGGGPSRSMAQGRNNLGGQFSPQAGMSQGAEEDLSAILGEEGGNGASSGVRFSGQSGVTGGTGQGGNVAGDLSGAAGASNSFLLAGNVVDATAPPMQHGRQGRFFRFGGGPGGPGGPGGGAGMPFGGGGRGQFFFGGFRRPRVNRIRGSLFDSYTNSAFDARPYPLNTPSQPQAPFYRERFGLSLGGPLNIPKIYNGGNKTSFFVHFDLNRGTSPENLLASVPTALQREGDFSATTIASGPGAGTMPIIYQPSASLGPRTPFTGNVIPPSMLKLNQASLGLLQYIPLPNLPGQVQNYHVQFSLPTSSQMIMGRVGRQISAKDNLAVVYFYNSSHTDGVTGFPDITSTTTTRMQNVNLSETHNFGAKTVNNFSVNFNRARTYVTNPFSFNQDIAGNLGIQGVSQNPMDWGLPSIGFTNFSSLGDATPSLTRNQTLRFSNSLLYNVGKHNFEFGGDVSKIQLNTLTNPDAEGSFSFTGYSTSNFTADGTPVAGTGYDFADFLLGLPLTTSERYGIPANYLRSARFDLFGQDDWRMTNHLSLNLGGRWEYAAPFTEKYGHLSDLQLGQGFSTVGVATGQNPGSLPASLVQGRFGDFAPRAGIAYRPWISHSLVVRAGYGMFYDESVYQNLVNGLVNQAPFATTSTLTTNPSQILTLQNGFPALSPGTATNTYVVDPHFLTPYAQSWNVMLEQDLSQTYILSVAYIGTRGTHLNLLLVPNTGTASALPFEYDTSGASSLYNGLRISLRHFSRRNLSFFLNYTYSKAEDNAASVGGAASTRFFRMGGPGGLGGGSAIAAAASPLAPVQNPNDLNAEWALSGFNPTHSVRAFVRYQLPFGDRMRFLNNGGMLAHILSNWSVMDITSFTSGLPSTAFVAGNASNNVSGLAPFGGLRADATGVPIALPSSEQSTLQYFNTAAFAVPAAGEFGNAGRNTIPGPHSLSFDMSLDRRITISRQRNLSANIRLATSNTFNLVNYSGLSTIVNSSTFGRVTGVNSMRTMTLSVRFRF